VGPRQHRRVILLIYADYQFALAARHEADSSGAGAFETRGSRCCVQPGPPTAVGSARTASRGATRRPMTICLGRVCRCALAPHGPQNAEAFARHGDDRHLGPRPIRQVMVSLRQALRRRPGVRDHRRRLARLPPREIDADLPLEIDAALPREIDAALRAMPVTPGRLDEDMATVTVPRLGDRAEPRPITTGVFAREEAAVTAQRARMLEAAPVDERRGQDHRRLHGDPAETRQLRHHRGEGGQLGQPFDRPIQFLTALELVHEPRRVRPVHEAIRRRERRAIGGEMLPPLEVRRPPVGALPAHEPAPRPDLEDVMPRRQDRALKRVAAAHDVADPLVGLARRPRSGCAPRPARRRDKAAPGRPRRACGVSGGPRTVSGSPRARSRGRRIPMPPALDGARSPRRSLHT